MLDFEQKDTKTSKSLTILVTGGAGFIGSAVVRDIIHNTAYSVVNVDNLTYAGNLVSLTSVSGHQRYTFEKVNVCDAIEVERVFNQYKPDIVMHLAAESHVDRSIDDPGKFIQTNIVGTYILLEQARAYWSRLGVNEKANFRFHHISTDEVYGDLPYPDELNPLQAELESTSKTGNEMLGQVQNDSSDNNVLPAKMSIMSSISPPLFTETTPYAPSSPYSASKAASDHLVRAWQKTYGLPTLVTNCSNNYGPYHFPEKFIPLIVLNALEGKSLPIYGKGNQIRDWLYVDDHARALLLVATQGKVGETYNIGGHNEKQNIEVVDKICEILEELAPIKNSTLKINHYKDLKVFVKDRPGHDMRYAIDASKIQRELGWTPQETFESGIRKTVQWYLDNQAWCQQVQDGTYQRERLGSKQ